MPTGRLVATLSGHAVRVPALAFSADGTALLSCSDEGLGRIWETTPGR